MIVVIIGSSLILFLALCAARICRRRSAAVRHFILTIGLLGSLLVPFMGKVVPVSTSVPLPELSAFVYTQAEDFIILPAERMSPPPGSPDAASFSQANRRLWLWVWIIGAAIGGTIMVIGAAKMALVAFRSIQIGGEPWQSASKDTSDALHLKRRIRILQNRGQVLGTWGVVRPAVLIPRNAESWSPERIRIVLTHEFAHVKRLDWPVQLLAEMARVVYWFNPLFWIACRWLRTESELACDDVVLNVGIDARDYASHLLDLVRALRTSHRVWSPILAMSRPPSLERRFVAMLNPSLNHRLMSRGSAIAISFVALCVTMPLAAMRPEERTPLPSLSVPAPVTTMAIATKPGPSPVKVPATKSAPLRKPVPTQGRADGRVQGTVYDGTGAVVPGVRMQVTRADGQVEETVTDEVGRYTFSALTEGVYLLTARLPGFANSSQRLEVRAGQSSRANFTLSVGGIAQRVEVSVAGQPRAEAVVPAGAPQRIRVGGNVVAANLISQVKPIYPASAQSAGREGTLHLQGIIGVDGSLIGLRVLSSPDPDLAVAAFEAVRQWRYRPTLLNNVPVEVITDIDVDFKIVQ
jgi:TonB family protein